jgi:glycerol-3-phosphate O-acyltransferase/dihydroxyacetone phosphate acyltransferase
VLASLALAPASLALAPASLARRYFSVKIFFHSILSIFFSQVEIIGMDNIPRNGPVIFVGNHANQFVDGIMLMMTAQHKVSFLVAEKSWYRPIIGHFAYAMGAVPVARAQDKSKKGSGSFKLTASRRASDAPAPADGAAAAKATTTTVTVSGSGTAFSDELRVGDKCRVAGSDVGLKVVRIQSDEALELEVPLDRKEFLADTVSASDPREKRGRRRCSAAAEAGGRGGWRRR